MARRCGNCGARDDAGGHSTCHRGPPPWGPVDTRTGWCWMWVPESDQDAQIVVTDEDVDAVLESGLDRTKIATALLVLERRLDRGGL